MCLASTHTTAKLQLNYGTNIRQNCQKIELYGSLTTKELKKPHSSTQVGGTMQRQNRLVTNPRVMHTKWRYILRVRDPNPILDQIRVPVPER